MAILREQRAKMLMLVMATFLLASPGPVVCQNPAFNNDPANANAETNVFYFDSNSDCNSQIRELYGFEARIRGADISQVRTGPTSCTIRLRSTSQYDGTVLDIEVVAMNILDCGTQVAIYDGDGANLMMMSYDCRSSQNQNQRRLLTSGDTATFMMTRQNPENVNFDIEIRIKPVRAGQDPGYENDYGSDSIYHFDKFEQDTIAGLIGGFYLLILLICTVILIVNIRNYKGMNKAWETHQLATIRTGAVFDTTRSQPSHAWSMEMKNSRGPASQYSHPRPDAYPRKTVPPSEDGDSGVFRDGDVFQKQRLVNEEREKARTRYVSNNASFAEPEEDPDHFVEKVITPRVKTNNHRNRRPPSYEEAISDHPSDRSSEEESEGSSSNTSIRKRPLSSEEERSRSSRSTRSGTPSETESEEESEYSSDEDRSRRGRGARARRHKPKPRKNRRKDSRDDDGASSRSGRNQQQQQQQPLAQYPQMQPVPYGAYPPGQFVPVMAGPVPMVPGYAPPQYPHDPHHGTPAPVGPQPTEPPVYSYLVRRGYTPMDEHSTSSVSAAGSGRKVDDEIRLESGVEYMRR